ncbi:hypothetical protein BB559_001822 [Furculomyces boomerangus]|uniref:Uncharacterized protein n=2 Tax=Harpellales TaxID=61421 RepID=A0A2T9Z061_9FUNG|nr:hypothetical protein BB559_001822 [Furculomyces boomerangus]PWA03752.1 hypothetical protein BB558_000068 [Smittium angustum]
MPTKEHELNSDASSSVIINEHVNEPHPHRMFSYFDHRYRMRHYFAEFFGTALLIFFGTSVNATVTFNPGFAPAKWVIITLGWGFGLGNALFVSMGNSGGHLNPAVTISGAIFGKFPWRKVPGYVLAQILGAFFGSALTFGVFRAKFNEFDGGSRQTKGPQATAGIFATYPDPANSVWDSFFTELLLTCILVFVIQGFFDDKMTPAKGFGPIAVGLLVLSIGISAGTTTGYAINPARDFGPRLFTLAAGWGAKPFQVDRYYFWNPIVAPIVGGILGHFLYEFFIVPNKD